MREKVIIIGAGPCGLAAAISLQKKGIHPLIIEKENIVNSISNFPTHQTFFSSAEKLAIGDIPFIIEERKPKRNQALAYYREVTSLEKLRINTYETVKRVEKLENAYYAIQTCTTMGEEKKYFARYVIIATGYYDQPNMMNIPGEDLNKVFHYFKEAHPFYNQDVVVIGGKNSTVDATLELEKAGARVTVLYRGQQFSDRVKPWILPEFLSLVNHQLITMHYGAVVHEIRPDQVIFSVDGGEEQKIKNDFVFAMTGYHPDHSFLQKMGIQIDPSTGRPHFNPDTMETNMAGIFIAGCIAAGNDTNEIFIENGRFHGPLIAEEIYQREANE